MRGGCSRKTVLTKVLMRLASRLCKVATANKIAASRMVPGVPSPSKSEMATGLGSAVVTSARVRGGCSLKTLLTKLTIWLGWVIPLAMAKAMAASRMVTDCGLPS